eukprot:CAMPEP_0119192090 /NCGR_PEP_ID=MMETSP1316-20130426/2694_1 /TAXON_ID=41880 /ORGANISM="Pycnococcus provasolii, Strain RCC2336" /LENGTH=31 /DNA_ID= /DNA_START= /DNA_END= /DNA_ORIENTATION=
MARIVRYVRLLGGGKRAPIRRVPVSIISISS